MTDESAIPAATPGGNEEVDALLSRLHLIEDQPLEQRATAFAQIHDRLQHTLEGGDASQQHG
jgi:hypothetical protein